MSMPHSRRKGFFGEELIAAIVVVVLLTVFIMSVIHINNDFLYDKAFIDAQRKASVLAEKLYFDADGITDDPAAFVSIALPYPAKIVLTDAERNLTWESGGTGDAKTVASASAAMLVSDGRLYPARLEVFVAV